MAVKLKPELLTGSVQIRFFYIKLNKLQYVSNNKKNIT